MKKSILTLALIIGVIWITYAQNTNYGVSSGTLGSNNSFFGYFSGNTAGAASSYNSFFGSRSGQSTTSGLQNTGIGYQTLFSNTTGNYNTANGVQSLYSNTTGSNNIANGVQSLFSNTTGYNNAAYGFNALYSNTTGHDNTANGMEALFRNQGSYNTANGRYALYSNTTASDNTATGYQALYANTIGQWNTASGSMALYSNTTGRSNTAHGFYSLYANATGDGNTAVGFHPLHTNSTGGYNTAIGHEALYSNSSGWYNTASGYLTQHDNTTGNNNTGYGYFALFYNSTGNYNTAIGAAAGSTITNLSNSTALGYSAIPTASNQVRIGNSSVTSIGGYANWTNLSDNRFKKDVKEDAPGLDFINQLRPVSYTLDKDALDLFLGIPDSIRQQLKSLRMAPTREVGFIAQEVENVVTSSGVPFQGVVKSQNEKDPYGISYATFVVPLVKAVQELADIVEEQKSKIDLLLEQLDKNGVSLSNVSTQAALFQNAPNPFSTNTEIKMEIPETALSVTLMVYNLEGKQLKQMQIKERGNTKATIPGNELSAGMYLYTLIVDGEVIDTKRMILIK